MQVSKQSKQLQMLNAVQLWTLTVALPSLSMLRHLAMQQHRWILRMPCFPCCALISPGAAGSRACGCAGAGAVVFSRAALQAMEGAAAVRAAVAREAAPVASEADLEAALKLLLDSSSLQEGKAADAARTQVRRCTLRDAGRMCCCIWHPPLSLHVQHAEVGSAPHALRCAAAPARYAAAHC
jgi:hypothetical protein